MTPTATGTLGATPLAHSLIYARNRRLTGRLELTASESRSAAVTLWRGSITAVETTPPGLCPGGFLGAVIYELGFIDSATLDSSLMEISKSKRLHGEVLLERHAITIAQRDEALVEQIHRKIHFLFSLPEATEYAFYDAKAPPVEPPVAVDCVGPVWRGIRDYPPKKFVEETIRRVGDSPLRATAGGSARLPALEASLFRALAANPRSLAEMKADTELPPARIELLVYLLVIAKCVEAVSGARTHPSTGALPATMASGPIRTMLTPASPFLPRTPRSSPRLPAAPGSPTRNRAVSPSPGRLPAAPGSSGRLPAMPGSQPRLPAAQDVVIRTTADPLAGLRMPAELGFDGIVLRAATVETESYFEVLGVNDGASAEAVRAAYMRLAKAWHPDRLVPDFLPVHAEVARIFSHMSHAQRTLCDAEARRAYLASRSAAGAARPRDEVIQQVRHAITTENFPLVLQLCDELVGVNADDAEAHAVHAWAAVRGGESPEEELRAVMLRLDKAVSLDRTCDEAFYRRGLIQKRLGNVPAAFRDFARAMQLNPKHTEAEREVRIFAMRVRKGSGEHKLIAPILEKLNEKK